MNINGKEKLTINLTSCPFLVEESLGPRRSIELHLRRAGQERG